LGLKELIESTKKGDRNEISDVCLTIRKRRNAPDSRPTYARREREKNDEGRGFITD